MVYNYLIGNVYILNEFDVLYTHSKKTTLNKTKLHHKSPYIIQFSTLKTFNLSQKFEYFILLQFGESIYNLTISVVIYQFQFSFVHFIYQIVKFR